MNETVIIGKDYVLERMNVLKQSADMQEFIYLQKILKQAEVKVEAPPTEVEPTKEE